MKEYLISTDYSSVTGLRYCEESDFSGEHFYHTKLNTWFTDAYKAKQKIKVILDGGEDGYGPSFRDEAFGNLVFDFSLAVVNEFLIIESPGDEIWKEEIESLTFPDWESRRKDGKKPKITADHSEWYRLENGKLESRVWINKQE